MRKIEHIMFLILMSTVLFLANSRRASPLIARAEGLADLADMQRELQLLNLLNGLELRASQMRFIIDKAQQAEDIRDQLINRADESIEEYQAEMTGIAREVKVILEHHQIHTLRHFGVAGIASHDEAPISQSDVAIATEEVLARTRAMPDTRFERNKQEMARGLIEHLTSHLSPGFILVINEKEEIARMVSILDQARALSGVEFELQKADLVEQALFVYGLHEPPVDTCQKIERYLLDPRIIPLLTERLALMERNVVQLG